MNDSGAGIRFERIIFCFVGRFTKKDLIKWKIFRNLCTFPVLRKNGSYDMKT